MKNTIYTALCNRGWKEIPSESDSVDFDLFFSERAWHNENATYGYFHLAPNQRVLHFPNDYELTRKDHMYKNLRRYRKQLEKEGKMEQVKRMNFFAQTFNMPAEYSLFYEEYRRNPSNIWIMKPVGKCQGRGIFLVSNLSQLSGWKNQPKTFDNREATEQYIAQRYIMNPLLVGGKKFDMRIYVLVTSYNPLTVWLYREGFARFTHERYSNNIDDMSAITAHLTNVAIQKNCENYDSVQGGKWSIRKLKLYLISRYGEARVNQAFADIQELIMCSILSVQKVIMNDKHCYELYGYDVLLDDTLKPWLIEINGNPSLTANTGWDRNLKVAMLDDMCTILDLEKM